MWIKLDSKDHPADTYLPLRIVNSGDFLIEIQQYVGFGGEPFFYLGKANDFCSITWANTHKNGVFVDPQYFDSKWHHIAFSFKEKSGGEYERNVVFDGLDVTPNYQGLNDGIEGEEIPVFHHSEMLIGISCVELEGGPTSGAFAGSIDNIRIYDYALTVDEILAVWNAEK